jgi:WD40 repeat protein
VHGTGYSFQFSAAGGYLPVTFSVTSGVLPPGLSLGSNGSLTGTPTTIGVYTFTVTANDSPPRVAPTSTLPFTIGITNPPPPSITSGAPPTATEGMAYSFTFFADNGLPPLAWGESGATGGLSLSAAGILSGTPTTHGIFPITVTVTDALGQSSPVTPETVRISLSRPAPTFTATGSLRIARAGHTATLLNNNGKAQVLVAGGPDSSAELYDPPTGLFTDTGSMSETRRGHAATLLNSGKVLIVGPADATAELYDPATGKFAMTGSMTTARTGPVATLLSSGKVLIVGGNTVAGDLTAELYDPSSGKFTATASMTTARTSPTATLLVNGNVLVAGGTGTSAAGAVMSAELYDPLAGTFSATGSMTVARSGHAALRLQDGTVLVVGAEATGDLYDPTHGTFTAIGNPLPQEAGSGHTLSLRSDGSVLVTGGTDILYLRKRYIYYGRCTTSRFVSPFSVSNGLVAQFGPESEGFTLAGHEINAREGETATTLGDGSLLLIGGVQFTVGTGAPCSTPVSIITTLSSAELIK